MNESVIKQLGASLQGRLRNTDLPISKCLYPLFEAVVNAIYAIDDRLASDTSFNSTDAKIIIRLNRAADSDLFGGKTEITSITIEDNGIGFNDDNLTLSASWIQCTEHQGGVKELGDYCG